MTKDEAMAAGVALINWFDDQELNNDDAMLVMTYVVVAMMAEASQDTGKSLEECSEEAVRKLRKAWRRK